MQIALGNLTGVTGQFPLDLPPGMTGPLWGLVIFILWTIAIVVLLLIVRLRHLAAGGSSQDFGIPNNDSLLWRLFRIHANLTENLPLYLGVVLLLLIRGASGMVIDWLAGIYMAFRLIHSLIHLVGGDPSLRLLSLSIQLGCLIYLTVLALPL